MKKPHDYPDICYLSNSFYIGTLLMRMSFWLFYHVIFHKQGTLYTFMFFSHFIVNDLNLARYEKMSTNYRIKANDEAV